MVRSMIMVGLCAAVSLCSFDRNAYAESVAYDGDKPTVISDQECRDVLRYYRSLEEEVGSIIPPELLAQILGIANSSQECQSKIEQIGALLEAFWATDPWCQRDRQKFVDWLSGYTGSKIAPDTKSLIWTLLESNVLACYEGLTAGYTIARHFDAESLPQEVFGGVVPNASGTEVLMDVDKIAKKAKRERRKEQRGRCSGRQSRK